MDFLFTLLICAPYPAIGIYTARSVLRDARTQLAAPLQASRRLPIRTWLYAAAMVPLWPTVELIPEPSPAAPRSSGRPA
ncbi:hypothetical protein OHS18_13375 [Amycolatopsis sp. NBC_00355]|uniref:hypothetical protein n=1 Tax=Amycolatopsis sp. NBC_00355 TaxID=2975957 RepID=UPI002E269321